MYVCLRRRLLYLGTRHSLSGYISASLTVQKGAFEQRVSSRLSMMSVQMRTIGTISNGCSTWCSHANATSECDPGYFTSVQIISANTLGDFSDCLHADLVDADEDV